MIDFDEYNYYPSLRTRLWEIRGYKQLDSDSKNLLVPTFVLSKLGAKAEAPAIMEALLRDFDDRPLILDLETHAAYACDNCPGFLDAADDFRAWREFVANYENVVPTALIPQGAPIRNIVRQVVALQRDHERVVVRSRSPSADLATLTSVLSAVESVDGLMIVLDFGYVRSRVSACSVEAAQVINALRTIDPATRVVVMGSSYPKSAAAYGDTGAHLDIEERQLHLALGGDAVTIYGDHGSIHPEPFEPSQARFVPRIDYALPDEWIFRRARADRGGFIECARQIVALPDWDAVFADQCWGAGKIREVAGGVMDGMGSPGPWVAARVNMHLWNQARYQPAAAAEPDVDLAEDEF